MTPNTLTPTATLPRGIDLPSDDGEPMETPWHRRAMELLIDSVETHRRDRSDFYVGGNMFFYYSPDMVRTHDFRGPDFFVVNGVERFRERLSWVTWEESWRLPNVIVELTSESTAHIDRGAKHTLYTDRLAIPEYVIVDPAGWRLEGWRRYNGTSEPMEPENGRLWLRELELYLGFWTGSYRGWNTSWPRLFEVNGRLVPTGEESERANAAAQLQQAETARAELARRSADVEAMRRGLDEGRSVYEAARATTEESERRFNEARAGIVELQAQMQQEITAAREATARLANERTVSEQEKARADAAEAEIARLKAELDALRKNPNP